MGNIFTSTVFSSMFSTVISGVLVFVASQFCLELWIKPSMNYKRLKQKIEFTLIYYSDVITNPIKVDRNKFGEFLEQFPKTKHYRASEELRMLGCEIASSRKKSKLNHEISAELIFLSNSMWHYIGEAPIKEDRNFYHYELVMDLLRNQRKKKA